MKLVIDIRAQLHITSEERFVMTSLFLECVRAVTCGNVVVPAPFPLQS